MQHIIIYTAIVIIASNIQKFIGYSRKLLHQNAVYAVTQMMKSWIARNMAMNRKWVNP